MNQTNKDMIDLHEFEEDELDELFNFAFPPPNVHHDEGDDAEDELLSDFLNATLGNMGWSRDDLAEQLATDVELVDAILEGTLPESEIRGDLLEDMAHAIGYEPEILHLMLEYGNTPQADLAAIVDKMVHAALKHAGNKQDGIIPYANELDTLQQELVELLMQGFGGYYNAEMEDDHKQQMLYEGVIKAIKSAIANYQSDIEDAREKIQQIKANYKAEIKSIQNIITQLKTARAVEAAITKGEIDPEVLRIRERVENK